MTSERKTTCKQKLIVGGLVRPLAVSCVGIVFSSVAADSNLVPSAIKSCTKVKNGVYGKTRIVAGSTCPSGQWVCRQPTFSSRGS
jgi:hypothetical protein